MNQNSASKKCQLPKCIHKISIVVVYVMSVVIHAKVGICYCAFKDCQFQYIHKTDIICLQKLSIAIVQTKLVSCKYAKKLYFEMFASSAQFCNLMKFFLH